MIANGNFVIFEIGVVPIAGFVTSFLLTSALLKLAHSHGLLDIPNQRSSHKVPTPRGGGLAIVISSAATSCALAAVHVVSIDVVVALLGGGVLVAAVGFLDDRTSLSPAVRLAIHFAAALWALWWLGGFPALSLGGKTLTFGVGGYLLGALGIVWFLNLFNFMDGIDGIAASEAIFITWGSVVISAFTGSLGGVSAVAVAIGAASCGFLLWNVPPARIFMGDVGSSFLGFSIAVLALAGTHETPNAMWTWLILSGVFIVDATVTLVRRLIGGERVYQAHRSHAYQWLARRWRSHLRVTSLVLVINLVWLLPCAFLATRFSEFAPWIATLALIPLTALAIAAGSGRSESLATERSHCER